MDIGQLLTIPVHASETAIRYLSIEHHYQNSLGSMLPLHWDSLVPHSMFGSVLDSQNYKVWNIKSAVIVRRGITEGLNSFTAKILINIHP